MEPDPSLVDDPPVPPLRIEPERLPDGRAITFYSRPAADELEPSPDSEQ